MSEPTTPAAAEPLPEIRLYNGASAGGALVDEVTDSIVANRYRVERAIGRGAMGEVLEVLDLATGRRMALKRARTDEATARVSRRPRSLTTTLEHLGSLIRHEFVILSQLAHPNVVAVYECEVDAGRPFYTMELLRGTHPGAGSTMPWRDVCRMLIGLCEPLALLHSRRLVHRDIAPRNVFVEPGGAPKLIDFGAMASMVAHHRPIGTPATMAPEVWRREQLDGRADVFGLGALAYCALTGRHAFPARTLPQLPIIWQSLPVPPSEIVPEIPRALDELILAMLSLPRDGRPQSVGEVMQRIAAIGDFGLASKWIAPPEALVAPVLIGREEQCEQLLNFVDRVREGRGVVCLVRGGPGSGRTRLLEALSLRARETDMQIAHASASTLDDAPFALARELVQALAMLEPEAQDVEPPDAALALLRSDDPIDPSDEAQNVALQDAFVSVCEASARLRPLCLAIDDVDRADQDSIRAIVRLVRRIRGKPILVGLVAGSERPASNTPAGILFRQAITLECPPLDAAGVEALARSVFGEVPNVTRAARWAYRHSNGQFATALALFEYLVTSGVARFVSGAWELEADLDALSPPSQTHRNLELALHGRDAGRSLLELLSLLPRPFPLELLSYTAALPASEAAQALDDLVRAQLVLATGQGYVMRDYGPLRWAEKQLPSERRSELQRTLARLYEQHADFFAIQVAYHLWEAGDCKEADAIVHRLQGSTEIGLRDLVWRPGGLSVPSAFLEELLAYRKLHGDSPANLHAVRAPLLVVALVSNVDMIRHAGETLDQLSYDVGLDHWDRTDPSRPNRERMLECLGYARERFAATKETERGIPPDHAIFEIVRCIALCSSPCAFTYDVELTRKLSALMEPLRDLSLDSRIIGLGQDISFASIVQGDRVSARRRKMIEATGPVEGSLVNPLVRDGYHHLNIYYEALDLASEGSDEALELAKQLEAHPLYEVLGLQVRRTHALGCGRYDEAQRWRRRRELHALRTERSDNHLRQALLREHQMALRCRDVLEVSRCAPQSEAMAERFAGWKPWALLCRASFHSLSDEPDAARRALEEALADLPPFSHGAWQALTASLADVQNELGNYEAARQAATSLIEGSARLGIQPDALLQAKSALLLAQAGLGQPKPALEQLRVLLAETEAAYGSQSLRLGMLRETGCAIASLAKDYDAFSAHLDALGAYYSHHPSLRAQHARWVRKGKERFRKLLAVLEKVNAMRNWSARLSNGGSTQGGDDAGHDLLAFVLDELRSEAGQLYRVDASGQLQLMASRPDADDPTLLASAARSYAEWQGTDEQTTAEEDEQPTLRDSSGRTYVPLWLTKPAKPTELAGLVLVCCSAEQLAQLRPAFVKAVAMHLEALA